MFGRVFQREVLATRQTRDDVWSLEAKGGVVTAFPSRFSCQGGTELAVSITAGRKNIVGDVASHFADKRVDLLDVGPEEGWLSISDDTVYSYARSVYLDIERAMRNHRYERLHIFSAVPQAFMMCLGQQFAGMPETWVYDWNGSRYLGHPVPGGVL